MIFDSEEINDLATFEDPEILSVGINKVFVNGNLAFDKRKEVTKLKQKGFNIAEQESFIFL